MKTKKMNDPITNPFEPIMTKLSNLEKLLSDLIEANDKLKESARDKLMTRNEVAKYFNVSLTTINSWSNKGILKRYRLSTKVYYKKGEIVKTLNE